MRTGARIAAGAEVLEVVLGRHLPASMALTDWRRANRYAGSGDRAAIANLVFDALRRRNSLAWAMSDDAPRALALGAAPIAFAMDPRDVVAAANDGSRYSIGPLTEAESTALQADRADRLCDQPPHIAADFPEALKPSLKRVFAERLVAEMAAFRARAPVGLRANTLKADRDRVLQALAKFGPQPGRFAPDAVIVPHPPGDGRSPAVEATPEHGNGWFEVQDEGSQLAALLSGVGQHQQVLDMCAGAGGKTLAMAARMQNTGQIYAYDNDPRQLRPIFDRLKRAGVRNVQTVPPGDEAAIEMLRDRFDVVLIDAPCSGSGTWRRRPDTKWRLTREHLATRREEQRAILSKARDLVRLGGRLVYVTCSILPEENVDQVNWFREFAPEFEISPFVETWPHTLGGEPPTSADGSRETLLLTPSSHGTDGFFFAAFRRSQ